MNIPLYISIPLIVAFVHYDNCRRFWPYVWARVRRWERQREPYHPGLCRRYGPPSGGPISPVEPFPPPPPPPNDSVLALTSGGTSVIEFTTGDGTRHTMRGVVKSVEMRRDMREALSEHGNILQFPGAQSCEVVFEATS